MKATLTYILPKEKEDFHLASHADDFYFVLWDLDQELRKHLKYDHRFRTADEALEHVRGYIRDAMMERDISFDILS